MPSPWPKPNWDTPTDWQPVNIGAGRYPSWWQNVVPPEPLIDQSGAQSNQPSKEKTNNE